MIDPPGARGVRRIAIGLALLSLLSLAVTAWILATVSREQEILKQIIKHLPTSDLKIANELSGDLSLQSSLLALLVLNVMATAVAFVFVVRAYLSSEKSLADVKVLSSDILASMDSGVITTDENGVITSINTRGRSLLGWDPNGSNGESDNAVGSVGAPKPGIGGNIAEINRDHGMLAQICEESRLRAEPIRDRDYRVQRDGLVQTFRAGCTRLHNRGGQQIGQVIHVRDVTQKALMEERLRRMERYMGLGSLAAGLQHEIKNPLSALSLHIQLLCERLAKETGDAEVNESLDILNTEVKRIGSVLDGFRSYASINDIGRSPVDVNLLIEKLVRLLRPQAEGQKVQIRVQPSREMLGMIQADSVRLEQVFLNLAINAIASMPDGGVLCFVISGDDRGIQVDVVDTGKGIPAEIQPKIFDPYFTTRPDGTGMGLALCDKIIRQHNGNLDFQTSPQGTTFTVVLPVNEEV
ncbi:two-component system sensor histidine kinase NtrB [Rhodopirellula sallentina]|uniref:histidine kinase n=1 Tax=Rhodopirellula sallentina SM41 TaxID=1263870 RepID=M5TUW6_9BACT|nr:ATP-binding protein [Rhodopirellula sallentina]EMI52987.1 signal transduction histidine kinase, nitrogen specific, NtrB [Rhodopirellula sallentina SM41]